MPLTNAQYDEIMRGYSKRQWQAEQTARTRKEQLYKKVPRLHEIDADIASTSVQRAKNYILGDRQALTGLEQDIQRLTREKQDILTRLGLPGNYLTPLYTCPDCKDTGYIEGKKCHCLQQTEVDYLYRQSNLREILERENFSTFQSSYYSPKVVDPVSGLSSRQLIENAIHRCQQFLQNFNSDQKPGNLLFCGDPGIGKTFLTNCIAKELLDSGHSVIYFSAFQMFNILAKHAFERGQNEADYQNIFQCDLLIIDDLGTEAPNSFTVSQFFQCLNERLLHNRPVIISTNLDMKRISETYSERIFSRITENFTILRLYGEDIRIQKKLEGI